MVPIPESIYFPPLEKCLEGEQLLISWKTVSIALSEGSSRPQAHPTLEAFLSEPYVLQLLARPYNPYSFTTVQAKSAFETKTSAINITPTTKKEYSIADIKEDALWLSKEAQIDEVSALRIVVLEYQSRASAQLRSEFSDEEVASLQETGGDVYAEHAVVVPSTKLRSGGSGERLRNFNSQENRRLRALRLYLLERRFLLKCAGTFFQAALDEQTDVSEASERGNGNDNLKDSGKIWIRRVGENLLSSIEKAERTTHDCLLDSIRSLRAKFRSLENGSGWLKQEGGRADLEIDWLSTNIIEAIHTMEITFEILDSQSQIPSSEAVLEWFRFVSQYGFFDHFEPSHLSMQYLIPSLQSLVAVISLSMLDPQRAIECFYDQQDVVQSIENGKTYTTYISDPQTITDLHQFLVDAASGLSSLASPAVLAWSIILKTMRDTVTARKEARELRQSVRAEEALEDDASFDDEATSGTRGGRPRGGRRYSASSEGSVEAGMYDNFLETIKDMTPDDDPILFLGAAAVEGSNVFDVLTSLATFFAPPNCLQALGIKIRLIILALTRCSLGVLDYNPEVVTTTLAVLSGDQQFWDLVDSLPVEASNDPLAIFLEDEYLVQRLLDTAMSRYPYERLPFLKFIRAIAACRTMHDDGTPIAVKILEKIPSFTFQLPSNFREYETIQEEDNANTIQLTQDILLFQPRGFREIVKGRIDAGASSGSSLISTEFSIPIGTPGRIVSDSDSGPKVAIWFQEYSGLKYMGKLLETALTASDYVDATSGEIIDRDSLAEIISLFATLLHTSMEIGRLNDTTAESHSAACRILEEASDGLDRNRDIVTVIFKIFEEELQRQSTNMDSNNSLDVLIASLQFIFALVPILPGRVWPLLGRSELLDIDGRGGKLSSILGRVEIVNCRYDFVLSCTRVLQALVEDATRHAVLRKVGSKSLVRMGSKEDLGTGVPDQILSKVLLSFTRTMVDVFESACNWRFAVEKQRLELSEHISTVLQNILHYTYSVDDTSSKEEKLTKVLNPAAIYIVDFFLSTGSGQMRFRPILRVFLDGFSSPDMTFQTGTEKHWIGQVRAALYLTTTLMKLAVLLDRPTSQLEHQLFKVSPLVARLYAVRESYRLHVVKLLEALVISASSRKGEPPSLLGHLGPQTSEHFIHMLLDLDKPLDDDARVVAIWHLMSIVVSSRQQWFSIYLLTGRPPREALKKSCAENQAPPSRTLLKIALTALSDIKRIPMPRSMAMLEFISLSQNYWPWAMSDIHLKQSNFIKSILEFVAGLLPVAVSANEDRSLEGCFESRVAAYIAEVLAMYLYHSQQVGNTTASKDILTHIGFYTKCAVAVPAYNSSLHGNLRRNFEAKFPGCSLQHFKRTKLEAREFGREYFYDGQVANKMLSFDQAWTGRKNDGFAEELAKANVNLSLVDAQVALLHGWKLLAIELSTNLPTNPDLQLTMAKIVRDCLISNNRSQLPENIFARLNQTRADFALILLQRLVEMKCTKTEVLGLLSIIWETVRSLNTSFEMVLITDDADYFRSLLKMLFLALRTHTSSDQAPVQPNKPSDTSSTFTPSKIQTSSGTVQIVLDILNHIVAQGFCDLVAAIHERPTESVADDIALVTAILQTCLQVPGIEFSHQQILGAMAYHDVARVATTLFSWSDKLAIDGDPIYGELSILFLLELSSIPAIAEQLAVEGTLGHISTASITSYMRKANVSSLSEGLGPQRCYSIWVRGILPLLLNILDAVGSSVAAEIAIFLNQFPKLLQQSVETLDVPPTAMRRTMSPMRITYAMVSEVHSLALIIYVLSVFRSSLAGITDIPEVKWDSASLLDSVDHWLTERMVLRERILPMGLREMEMAKQKPLAMSMGCENRLEEKVVQELIGVKDVMTGGEA